MAAAGAPPGPKGCQASRVDDVVAAEPVERQPVVRLFLGENVHAGLQTGHFDATGVAHDAEHVCALAAV